MPVPPDFDKQMQLLTRVVREEDFRFVPILHNHPDILEATIAYLTDAYPDRPTLRLLASDYEYYSLQEAIYQHGTGFVFIEDFATILDDPDWAIPFNQRRDKFATFPIAMIVFLPIREQDMRTYMRAIPDLWSFRNLVLRMEVEVAPELSLPKLVEPTEEKAIITEIERLQHRLIILEKEEEKETRALQQNLYQQILERLLEYQEYEVAKKYLKEWKKRLEESELTQIYAYRIMQEKVHRLIRLANVEEAMKELKTYLQLIPNKLNRQKQQFENLTKEYYELIQKKEMALLSKEGRFQTQLKLAMDIYNLVEDLNPNIPS